MAVVKPGSISGASIGNTGSKQSKMLTQPWMVLFGSTSLVIPANVIDNDTGSDFLNWIKSHIHAVGNQKVYPYGGNKQPFDDTPQNNTQPTVHTSAITGAKRQMLAGYINLTLNTLEGGLQLAKALLAIGNSSLGVILFDQAGGFLLKKNSDGTYGFFNSQNSPGDLILQVKDTPFTNSINISLNPQTMIQLGQYYIDNSGAVLDLFGLTDITVDSRAAATTTSVTVGGTYDGGDIFDDYGSALAASSVWKVTKVSDGSTVTVSGVAQNTSLKAYVLTIGAQTSGTQLKVDLQPSDVLYTNTVIGVQSLQPKIITVP